MNKITALLLILTTVFLFSCGDDHQPTGVSIEVNEIILSGTASATTTTTANSIADTNADPRDFEIPLDLSGVNLQNGPRVINTINLRSVGGSITEDIVIELVTGEN